MTADRRTRQNVPNARRSVSSPIDPLHHGRWQGVGIVALAVAACGLLGACSSDDDGGGSAVDTTLSSGPVVTTAGDGSDPATTAASGAPVSTDLRGYFESIGVAPDVADCYAAALADIGITEVGLLETDPEKSAAAAALFDACIADPTGAATSTS
jgi:hypothetical protein